MHDLMMLILPLFGFMLLPIWIPIIAVAVGAVGDRLSPREISHAEHVVAAARTRNATHHSAAGARKATHLGAPLTEVA